MKLTLGLTLDGGHHPGVLDGREAAAGEAILGPSRFLSLLETRLGLGAEGTVEPIRVAQMASRLRLADDGSRFYSRSFAVDAVDVARQLLAWRDELVSAGGPRPCGSAFGPPER